MKANVFLTVIGIALSLLISYLVFNIAKDDENSLICGIGSAVCFVATIIPAIGLEYQDKRQGVNSKVLSFLFLVFFLISNFCFAGFGVSMPYYVIVNGLLLVIFLGIFYKIHKLSD